MPSNSSNSFLQSTTDFLLAPIKTLNEFYRDLAEVDDRLRDDSIVVRLLCLLTIPFRMLGGLASLMIQNWPTSRSGWAFIIGAPALLTMAGTLGAWVVVDYFYNEAKMFATNDRYYKLNVAQHSDTPESALSYAKKLVEIDPAEEKLKFQLGTSYALAGKMHEADDVMRSIAPDDEAGYPDAHIWRANYLTAGKSLDELRENMPLAQRQLELAMAADSNNARGKFQQALMYMQYADLLEEGSDERLNALVKADELFHEIQGIEDNVVATETEGEISDAEGTEKENEARNKLQTDFNIRFSSLRPSTRVRKQLEAIDGSKYDSAQEIERVKRFITSLMPLALRFNADSIPLWAGLINAASETRDADFTLDIIEQAFEVSKLDETKRALLQLKSLVLRRSAIAIHKFPNHEAYHQRLVYLCKAAKTMPSDVANYTLLLQYVGHDNPAPDIQFARAAGLPEPGEAVPVKYDWLLQSSAESEHTEIINILLGLQEFHQGDKAAAEKSWAVAQQFNERTRDYLLKFCDLIVVRFDNKIDNTLGALSLAVKDFPEAIRFRSDRGIYLKKQQQFQEAINDFRKALTKNPTDLALHKYIQFCLEYMGRPDQVANEEALLQAKLSKMKPEAQSQALQMLQQLEKNEAALNQKQNNSIGF